MNHNLVHFFIYKNKKNAKISLMQDKFKIETEVFQGPLDLLLSLIEKRKLLINDISLAKITDDYIEYIKNVDEFSLGQSSHFILIASTLLLIKSKSLLPTLELTIEEEQSIEDLELRLKIHKRMKDVEPKIEEMFMASPSFMREPSKQEVSMFAPSKQINIENISEFAKNVIKGLPKFEKTKKAIVKNVISLETMIQDLTKRIQHGINMSFKEFSGSTSKGERVNVVVSFLAMLELVKQGIINVKQDADFEDIHMETKELGTPSY